MKMNFEYLQTIRAEYYKQLEWKKEIKNEAICLSFMLPSLVTVLKLSKKVHFLQFCDELGKKFKS